MEGEGPAETSQAELLTGGEAEWKGAHERENGFRVTRKRESLEGESTWGTQRVRASLSSGFQGRGGRERERRG